MTNTQNQPQLKFIKTDLVIERTALSKSALYRRVKDGSFVPPLSLGRRAVAYLESEVDTVLSALVAGKSLEEIKVLVKQLVNQRQHHLNH